MKWRNGGNIIEYLESFKHRRGLYTVFRVFICIIYLFLKDWVDRMGIDLMRSWFCENWFCKNWFRGSWSRENWSRGPPWMNGNIVSSPGSSQLFNLAYRKMGWPGGRNYEGVIAQSFCTESIERIRTAKGYNIILKGSMCLSSLTWPAYKYIWHSSTREALITSRDFRLDNWSERQ